MEHRHHRGLHLGPSPSSLVSDGRWQEGEGTNLTFTPFFNLDCLRFTQNKSTHEIK